MRTSLPVNGELQTLFLRIRAYDDLFDRCAKDHLLESRRTAIAVPDFSKVLTHPTDSCFLLRRQRAPLSIEACKSFFNCTDVLQLFVPAAFQLSGRETIPDIYRVVLFKRLLCLVLQLLEFARQGGALCGIPCAQFLKRPQTGSHSKVRDPSPRRGYSRLWPPNSR